MDDFLLPKYVADCGYLINKF